MSADLLFDPALDLRLERVVDVSPEKVWAAWTQPEHVVKWFTPAPWTTTACEIDLRPGGAFRTTMRSPEGQEFPNVGCYLEIVPNRRLAWTNCLLPGFRPPAPNPGPTCGDDEARFTFTAVIELEPAGAGTRYVATAMHGDLEASRKHAEMGFTDGWGKALEQLVEVAQSF